MTFFLEIDLTLGYITETVAQRSGDLQIENLMRSSAQLLICAMWPPEAHEFDTLGVSNGMYIKKCPFWETLCQRILLLLESSRKEFEKKFVKLSLLL